MKYISIYVTKQAREVAFVQPSKMRHQDKQWDPDKVTTETESPFFIFEKFKFPPIMPPSFQSHEMYFIVSV